PVTAAPPDANACIITYKPAPMNSAPSIDFPNGTMPGAWWMVGRCPTASWYTPQPMSTAMFAMKKYVGTANTFPDSRTPRRLPNAMRITNATEIGRIHGVNTENADASAAVPAATDTDTVST